LIYVLLRQDVLFEV